MEILLLFLLLCEKKLYLVQSCNMIFDVVTLSDSDSLPVSVYLLHCNNNNLFRSNFILLFELSDILIGCVTKKCCDF